MSTNRWRLKPTKKILAAGAVLLAVTGGASAATSGSARAGTPIFTGNCAPGAGSGATGCGGVDDGTTTAPEPGYLADETPGASLIHTEQDAWNAGHGEQDMTVNSYHNWSVTATDGPQSTAEIQTYPETGWEYFNSANPARYNIRDLTSITSTYNEVMPPAADNYTAEAAYDIWLNNWATEVMIWTDVHYQNVDCGGPGWTPQCSGVPQVGTFTFNGQQWTLYGSGGVNGFWMWEPENGQAKDAVTEPNGSVIDVLDMLKQTAVSGGFDTASTITALEYGWEIANTNGVPLTFNMNDVEVSVNGGCCTAGGGGGGTAPVASTSAASGVTSSGATLNGTVNPEGAATTYQFDYGTTTSYGTSVPVPAGSAGSGSTAVSENAPVTGLSPSTTYHYRIEATNATGTTLGADQQFTTASGGGGGTSVAFDAAGGAKKSGGGTLSWTQAVGSGTNRALLADFTVGSSNDAGCAPVVKDNGVSMTEITAVHDNNQRAGALTVWGLVNPPSGTNTITASVTGCTATPSSLEGGSESFTGVSQSAPWGAHAIAYGNSATSAVTVASASASDLVGEFAANGSPVLSPASPTVQKFLENQNSNTGAGNTAGGYRPATGGSDSSSWNLNSDWWGAAAVDIAHA